MFFVGRSFIIEKKGSREGNEAAFFQNRTPETTLKSYQSTLRKALERGDFAIAEEIRSNMRILERFPSYELDIGKFTCVNTHGDFTITQLLCGDDRIRGVIDWTTACIHPAAWEIVRSSQGVAKRLQPV